MEASTAGNSPRFQRRFYAGMALAALAIIFIGFAPTFFLRPSSQPPLRPIVVAHAIIFSAWVLVFLTQTLLVSGGHTALHRRLGLAGAALAILIVVFGPAIALPAAGRGNLPGDPIAFLLVILVDILMFAGFAGAAMLYRRRSEVHKRLMVLATASLLPPAISRWPIAVRHPPLIAVILLCFVATLPLHDMILDRRPHPVSLWGSLALLLSIPIRFGLAQTEAWHRLARWMIGTG